MRYSQTDDWQVVEEALKDGGCYRVFADNGLVALARLREREAQHFHDNKFSARHRAEKAEARVAELTEEVEFFRKLHPTAKGLADRVAQLTKERDWCREHIALLEYKIDFLEKENV